MVKKAKCLVTGGAGFIGSHVVDRLVNEGHEVVVVDNLVSGKKENVNPRANFYQMDITSPELKEVFKAERPRYVNHHAAQIDVRKSVTDPLFDAQVNVIGTINLLEYCRAYKVDRIIFASSGGAIYGDPKYLPADEEHPIAPISPYGLTKFIGEQYLRMYSSICGLRYVTLRYGNVYGPRQDPFGEAGVIAIFVGKMLQKEQPTIFGTGEQIRDYVYVGDIVDANLQALEAKENLVVNIGTGAGTSVNQLFQMLKDQLKLNLEPIYDSPRAGELEEIYLDAAHAKAKLVWSSKTNLVEGLDKTIAFFRGEKA